ncbi:ABC transporter ATP-binding protein [Oceaniglobus indicus]|uniref:ABC transporter ATP-binding protein n=1 Tax=Oceaniglobus indicus TaxID=2047749 RepID=UPI000C176ACF|nr:ATP-binding cassette domain-containing protein [Oceaniglobus indicus]
MTDPVLAVRGLCKRFGALAASRDISFDLRQGEIHALIGPNGAGKSTLIAQLAGGLKPDAGQVILNGDDVTALDTAARARRGLARTFQVSDLAGEDTVLQNAVLGALGATGRRPRLFGNALGPGALRGRAHAALERTGLGDVAAQRVADLSHGQRRLLEIAVALTLSPRVFVMDEPMAGLDGAGALRLRAMLAGLKAEAPILLVEHDMDAVFALADRISVLVEGRIIATGTVDEVRVDVDVRRAYLGDAP